MGILYLATLQEEGDFVGFLQELMRQPEHAETAKLVYCRLSGQTPEEFAARAERMAEIAQELREVFTLPTEEARE